MPGRSTERHVETLGSQSISSCDDFEPRIICTAVPGSPLLGSGVRGADLPFTGHRAHDFSCREQVSDFPTRIAYISGRLRLELPLSIAVSSGTRRDSQGSPADLLSCGHILPTLYSWLPK